MSWTPRRAPSLPAIDRSTTPEEIKEFREDVGRLSAEKLSRFFRISRNTVQEWEKLGAPRLVFYALVGLAVVELGLNPWKLRLLKDWPKPKGGESVAPGDRPEE